MSSSALDPNQRKSVLLLAYYYLPATTSGVQRAVRFARYLPKHGYRTFVVSSSAQGTLALPRVTYVPNSMTDSAVGGKAEWIAKKIQCILPYNEQLPWSAHAVAASRELAQEFGISAVISTSPPASSHFAAFWLKQRLGLKWIADFRDPLLGNPGRNRRWAVPYDYLLERSFLRYADKIMTVTDTNAEHWRQRYPRWRDKFHVVWNGYDPAEAFHAAPITPRRYRMLSHVGVLYEQRHPLGILSAVQRLTSQGRVDPGEIHIQFIGPILGEGFRSHPVVASLEAKGCLRINGKTIPRPAAMTEIATSDYLLLLDINNLDNAGYTVPAKLYDYVLTGRPILAATSPQSPVDRILSQSGIPYRCIYHTDSSQEIESKLLDFFQLPSTPQTPSSWFLNTFDGDRQAGVVASLLDRLLGS